MSKVLLNQSPHAATYFHANPDDKSDQVVIEKCFDAEPAIEHATYMRNEVRQTGRLRKAMSVPMPLLFQWLREGKLGEESFVNGSIVVDQKRLQSLMTEYSRFSCLDKL